MEKTDSEFIKKDLVDKIVTYCKKLKKHAQENNINLSNIYIEKR